MGIYLTNRRDNSDPIRWAHAEVGVGSAHGDLVVRAQRWLINSQRCVLSLIERCAGGAGESPDAIGWRPDTLSILVECKVSVMDFYADRQKPWRKDPNLGVGYYRYFLTPPALIDPLRHSLPDRWGLLEVRGNRIRMIVRAGRHEVRNLKREMKLLIQPERFGSGRETLMTAVMVDQSV